MQYDRLRTYMQTACHTQLQTREIVHLLESFIEEEKNGEHIVSEAGEDAVQELTSVLLEKGSELLKQKRYLEAASTGFAILVVLEPELCNVYDEGCTYQCIMKDAFNFLETLATQKYSLETATTLLCIAIQFFEARREDDRYYDREWKTLIFAIQKN